jgi:fibronectin-binding autotransporter adhesin
MVLFRELRVRARYALTTAALFSAALFGVAFLAAPAPAGAVNQTIPYLINFQGRLTDNNGNVLSDGSYNVKFRLFNVATGGSGVWEADRVYGASDHRVAIQNGLFDIQLGDTAQGDPALSTSLFNQYTEGSLYLEVELPTPATAMCASNGCATWTEGAMTPRQPLSSSPYAFNAQNLDGLDAGAFGQLTADNTFTGKNLFQPTAAGAVALSVYATTAGSTDSLNVYDSSATPNLEDYFDSTGALHVGQAIQPTTTTIDIGTSANNFRTGYFGAIDNTGSLTIGASSTSLTIGKSGVTANFQGPLSVGTNQITAGTLQSAAASNLTVDSTAGTLIFGSDTTALQTTSGSSVALDVNYAGASTLNIENTNGSNVANVNVSGGLTIGTGRVYTVGSTSGISRSCTSGQVLDSFTTTGGIITGGSCANLAGDSLDGVWTSQQNTTSTNTQFTVNFTGAAGSSPSFSNATQTLTLPSNASKLVVQLKAGGGGGGTPGTAATNKLTGGGGEGGYTEKTILGGLASNYYFQVGGGGAGGASGTNGSTGGSSCFGTNSTNACTSPVTYATGGSGGATANALAVVAGGSGGTGYSGDVNINGAPGTASGMSNGRNPAGIYSGTGGGQSGGQPALSATCATGSAGADGGGGGGVWCSTASTATGGAGGDGYLKIEVFVPAGAAGGGGSGTETLQDAYNLSTSPELTVNSSNGGLTIRDSTTGIGGNLLEVQNNAGSTTYFDATASGIDVTGNVNITSGVINIGGSQISSANLSNDSSLTHQGDLFNGNSELVQTTAGGALPVISGANLTNLNPTNLATGSGAVTLASGASSALTLDSASGNIVLGASTTKITKSSSDLTIDLPKTGTSTLDLTNSNGANVANLNITGQYEVGGTQISTADLSNGSNITTQGNTFNGNSELVQTTAGGALPALSGTNLTNLDPTQLATGSGAVTLQSASSSGLTLTSGTGTITLGSSTLSYSGTLSVSATTLSVSGGVTVGSGQVYAVGSSTGTAATCTGGDVLQNPTVTGGIVTGGTCGTGGGSQTLQNVYDNSTSPATITTSSSSKNVVIKSGSSDNSATALQVIPDGTTTATLDVDTLNNRVGIGTNSPAYMLDVAGNINTSGAYYQGGTAGISRTCSGGDILQNPVVAGGIVTSGTCATGGGGGGGSSQIGSMVAQVYDTAGGTDVNTATATPIPWGGETRVDSGYTHSTSSNNSRVTITNAGWYRVTYNITSADQGAGYTNSLCEVRVNGSTYNSPSSSYSTSASSTSDPYATNTSSVIFQASASDYVEVVCSKAGASGSALTVANDSWMLIEKLDGSSPFTSTSGVITQTTATDRLQLNIGATGNIGLQIQGIASQTADFLDINSQAGSTNPILAIDKNGTLQFGAGGTSAVDTNLYRAGAGILKTDGEFQVGTLASSTATPVCLDASNDLASCSAGFGVTNLQGAYDGSSSPQITLGSSGLTIRDSSGGVSGNLFAVQNNGGSTTYFGVSSTGIATSGSATIGSGQAYSVGSSTGQSQTLSCGTNQAVTSGTFTGGVITGTLGCATINGTGANTALSNLTTTDIKTALLPDADNHTGYNIGAAATVWQNVYAANLDAGTTTTALTIGTASTTTGVTIGRSGGFAVSLPGGLTTSGGNITTANGTINTGSGSITTTGTVTANTVTGNVLSFQPTTNATTAIFKQTTAGSPTADIFDLQTASSTYLIQATSTGALTLNSPTTLTATSAGALTVTAGANSTWSTSAGDLTISSGGNLYLNDGGSTYVVRIGDATNNMTFTAGTGEPVLNGTAQHSRTVTFAPEYANATLTGSGTNNSGNMTAGFCSNTVGTIPNTNTSVCASGQQHNYYQWNPTVATPAQTYDVYLRYQIPSDYANTPTVSMYGWRTGSSDAVTLYLYDSSGTLCGSSTNVATGTASWTTNNYSISTCSITAGSTVLFKVDLSATSTSDYARAGEITFTYKSKW